MDVYIYQNKHGYVVTDTRPRPDVAELYVCAPMTKGHYDFLTNAHQGYLVAQEILEEAFYAETSTVTDDAAGG